MLNWFALGVGIGISYFAAKEFWRWFYCALFDIRANRNLGWDVTWFNRNDSRNWKRLPNG